MGRAPSQLQVGSCMGGHGSVWVGDGGPWASGRNVNFYTLAGGQLGGVGQEVSRYSNSTCGKPCGGRIPKPFTLFL